ncbi:MAG: ATP-binding protein [Saprospirales bacterium]|nr:ATP-binding protein [Saprospirales bacterium]
MLKLSSNVRSVSKVEPFVEKLVSRYNLDPNRKCDILVSLTEAVTNAIVHGNCESEDKMVKVRSKKEKDCISVQVSDEGQGFDMNTLPDPTTPERIHECGGRGVFLMKQLCDNLRFYNNGSTVEMSFRIK